MSEAHSHGASGWIEASAFVVGIGALSLAYAVGQALGAHPVAFVLYAMLVSAGATLAFAGVPDEARAIARHPLSWVIGASIILIEVFYFATLAYVSPAHGNLVLRIGIPLAIGAGWILRGRRPPPLGIAGALVIVATTGFVVVITPAEVRWPMTLFGVLAAVFMVVRGFAAEFHRWNRAARTVRAKLRVTGVLLLVTSLLSLVLAVMVAGAIAARVLPPLRFVPTLDQMLHLPTIALGCIVGGAILAFLGYLNFSSVVKIGTANLTAMMAFSPVTSWFFQELGVALGWIAAERPGPRLVAAMMVFIAAVLLIFRADRRAESRSVAARASRCDTRIESAR